MPRNQSMRSADWQNTVVRYGEQDLPARYSSNILNGVPVVWQVLDYLGRQDAGERAVRKGHRKPSIESRCERPQTLRDGRRRAGAGQLDPTLPASINALSNAHPPQPKSSM